MKIRQAFVLSMASPEVEDLVRDLSQIGLDISSSQPSIKELASDDGNWSESLFVIDSAYDSTPSGRAAIRLAANSGGCLLNGTTSTSEVLDELRRTGGVSEDTRRRLAASALFRCIEADARDLAALQGDGIRAQYLVNAFEKVQDLRYGENWHQRAALYRRPGGLGLHQAAKLNGKAMSYNNVVDAEAVLEMLVDLSEYDGVPDRRPLSVIVKHTNPCGVAYGDTLEEAYRHAFATDPKSAFGGVFGFNRRVDVATARAIGDSFIEVLLAPGYEPEALEMLTSGKPNRRILDIGDLLQKKEKIFEGCGSRCIFGGILLQDYDTGDIKEWKVVTRRAPSDAENRALRFAWKVTKYVKSNALVYTTDSRTIGIGTGQVSRVDAAKFGAEKALEHGLDTRGTVAATDSFFPFRDGLDQAFKAGATAVVHPGGSIRDQEVIDAADEHGMAMIFTGMRHFRH
ncbi:MAG: phosphoribosylaminoimidazolecarboxamide formyltransferase [Methanosarcinales archaeon]|nr:phosphoribosylaminoimidazolecarboxamide formyltransferase [Methanosarcinales archaeon]